MEVVPVQPLPAPAWQPGVAPVAVIMISLNEGHNIEAVLRNLKGWAQEVFLVDSYSKDETVDIALVYGVHVVQRRFRDFGDQWNFALRELPITAPWTMKLDPDERLTDVLKSSLLAAMHSGDCDGATLDRRLWFMGRYWAWMPQFARGWLERFASLLDLRRPLLRRVAKVLSGFSLVGDDRLVSYFKWADRRDLKAIYTPAFRAALGLARAEEPMLDFLASLPRETHRLERMLALEQRFFLGDHNLVYTDKMSMAVGVETRVPFLDLDLVEFAARIPAKFKQSGTEGKWVLKKAMEPYLPHEVIYRPKTGFGVPLRRWMRVELRDLLSDVLSDACVRRRGLFDPAGVQRLIQANDKGALDASYTLLSLICVELWCRRFLDRGAAAIPAQFQDQLAWS